MKKRRIYISFHGKDLTDKHKDILCKGFIKYIEKAEQGKVKVANNG